MILDIKEHIEQGTELGTKTASTLYKNKLLQKVYSYGLPILDDV